MVTSSPITQAGYAENGDRVVTTSDGKIVLATFNPASSGFVVSIINSQTGDYIGTGQEAIPGTPSWTTTLDDANDRVYVPIDNGDGTSKIVLIDTNSGQIIGETDAFNGTPYDGIVVSGTRAYQIATTDDGRTTVTAFDSANGANKATVIDVIGSPANDENIVIDRNGHVYLTTFDYDENSNPRNTITVVDWRAIP